MSEYPYMNRANSARTMTAALDNVPDEHASEVAELLKSMVQVLNEKAAKHKRQLEVKEKTRRTMEHLKLIGPAYEDARKKNDPRRAFEIIQDRFKAPPETLRHYINKHEKLKTRTNKLFRERLVISMFVAGFSNEEIATQVKLSTRQIERILKRARSR